MIGSFTSQESSPKLPIHCDIAYELFDNVWKLYDQIMAQFSAKRPWEEMVGSQMAVSELSHVMAQTSCLT